MNSIFAPRTALNAGLLALLTAAVIPAQVCYVDGSTGSDSNSGISRLAPFRTLEAGLALAGSSSTINEIRLTNGVYVPLGGSSNSFEMVDDVTIRGGYSTGFIVRGLGTTALDGLNVRDSVVRAEFVDNVTLDRLTIRNGAGGTVLSSVPHGAGLLIHYSRVVVSNCHFENNHSDSYAGAASVSGDSAVTFSECDFVGNSAERGGALSLGSNQEGEVLILRCSFFGNEASIGGGAIIQYNGVSQIWNSEFSGNSSHEGGAIFFLGENSEPRIGNCTMAGNSAVSGGGISLPYGEAVITNSIIHGNEASLINPDIHTYGASLSLRYNCLGRDAIDLGGFRNIYLDPNLVDLDGADDVIGTADDDLSLYHPDIARSPCVDRGNNADISGAHLQLDRPGAERKQRPRLGDTRDGRVDIGAHEVQPIEVAFPGSDEGLEIRVLENGLLTHRYGSDGLLMTGGDNLRVYLESPSGSRTGSAGTLFLDLFLTSSGIPAPLPLVDVHFGAGATPLPAVVRKDNDALNVTLPAALAGTSLLLQGLVLDSGASNGVCATTNARVIEVY